MNQICMERSVRAGQATAAGRDSSLPLRLWRTAAPLALGAQVVGGALLRGLDRLAVWQARARERRALLSLSDHALHDMGLSRGEVYREYSKPSWRP